MPWMWIWLRDWVWYTGLGYGFGLRVWAPGLGDGLGGRAWGRAWDAPYRPHHDPIAIPRRISPQLISKLVTFWMETPRCKPKTPAVRRSALCLGLAAVGRNSTNSVGRHHLGVRGEGVVGRRGMSVRATNTSRNAYSGGMRIRVDGLERGLPSSLNTASRGRSSPREMAREMAGCDFAGRRFGRIQLTRHEVLKEAALIGAYHAAIELLPKGEGGQIRCGGCDHLSERIASFDSPSHQLEAHHTN